MNKPKRILIFSLVYFPRYVGGAEVAIKEITDRIDPQEIQFDMVTMDKTGPRCEKYGNVTVYRVGNTFLNRNKIFGKLYKYIFIFVAYRKALRLHKQNHYDAIWAMMANYAGFAALFFKNKNPNTPFVLSLQEGDSIEYIKKRLGIFISLYKKIFKKADSVQAISSYLAAYGKSMGYRKEPVIIPNGVANDVFSKRDEQAIEQIKNKFNKKSGDKFIITTSRLVIKNGIADLVSAMGHLPDNYKLLILGRGELDESLKTQVRKEGLGERVHFVGYVDHQYLPAYLHASDIFIRPSHSEGLGNSFIEAMAAGLPVIATPVGGIPDFLFPEKTGLFCEVGNPESIADAVKKLEDVSLQERITNGGLELARTTYDWKRVAADMHQLFIDQVIG